MNDIYDIDFTAILPPALSHDPKIIALAKGMADQLHTVSGEMDNVLIYSRFDELPEALVDILAYDMHVDWYDYTYPLKVKRDIVKNSVKVHKKMGTKYAVETALGSLWPKSEVEEWFQYGGTPHHFQVVCDVTEDRITASFGQLVDAIRMYKRLSSHLEGVVYQSRVTLVMQTHGEYIVYSSPAAGTRKAGTYPRRTTAGVLQEDAIILGTDAAGFIFTSPLAGTIPQRNIFYTGREAHITAETALDVFGYKNGVAGTSPGRNVFYTGREAHITAETEADAHEYRNMPAGVLRAGEEPHRAAYGPITEEELHGTEQETDAQPAARIEAAGFTYKVKMCGQRKL